MKTNNWTELGSYVKSLSSNWTSYTLLGSFIIYLTGYLSLRYHMTVLGLGVDITVFDERYLFAGIKFFVYIVSTVPILVLIGMVVYFPLKIIVNLFVRIFSLQSYSISNYFLLLTGITIAMISIQFYMRKCFTLVNLLVSSIPPKDEWLTDILTKNSMFTDLYFPLLLLALFITFIIWWNVNQVDSMNSEFFWLKKLLAFLIALQFLFLPINYGALIMDKSIPRVTKPSFLKDNKYKDAKIWLVWEGRNGMTYLTDSANKRTLITLNKKDITSNEILCYDNVLKIVLSESKVQSCIEN